MFFCSEAKTVKLHTLQSKGKNKYYSEAPSTLLAGVVALDL